MSKTMPPKPIAILAVKRAALYFLGLDILAFFYYAAGNGQEFLVGTQLLLLRCVSLLSAAAFLAAVAGLAVSVVLWIRRSMRFSVLALVGWTACATGAVALALFSSSVQVFAAGA